MGTILKFLYFPNRKLWNAATGGGGAVAFSKNAKMKSGAKISIREDKWLKTGVTGGKFVCKEWTTQERSGADYTRGSRLNKNCIGMSDK